MLLEILIPTFNRAEDLEKNLNLLANQIQNISDSSLIRVIISDNASTDNTISIVGNLQKKFPVELILLQSSENKGLECNAVKILSHATAQWVMFLGDDDFLPDGYIQYVIDQLKLNKIGCIIPGFSGLHKDGSIVVVRAGEGIKAKPGFRSILQLSHFGHQLSGLVIHRDQTLEGYLSKPNFRNIYLFIYFLIFNLNQYESIYAPEFQVLVSQGNKKDWGYDDSGLLTEIYQNYFSFFEKQPVRAILGCLAFTNKQKWRLRLSKNPVNSIKAVKQILSSPNVPTPLKVSMPIYYTLTYSGFMAKSLLRKLLG